MTALHIQAELPSLLRAPEHTLQHCWGNCMHCWRNAFTQVLQISNLHLVHLSLCYPMQRRPRALDHASVLPRTVVSLVKSSVLGTSRWCNYAHCAQIAVARRPIETPPNPECCRQTIGTAGIAQACPGMMLTWLWLQQKKKMDRKCAVGWGPAPGYDGPFSSVRSAKFATQWSLWCRVPDWDDVLMLLDSALSPVI